MTSKKFTAGVKSGKIKYWNVPIPPKKELEKNETQWVTVSGSFHAFPPGYFKDYAKKQDHLAKLKKWGEEVVASYGR